MGTRFTGGRYRADGPLGTAGSGKQVGGLPSAAPVSIAIIAAPTVETAKRGFPPLHAEIGLIPAGDASLIAAARRERVYLAAAGRF
jgi:hypothetical protein